MWEAADWPWSSHAVALASAGPAWLDTSRLMAYFGEDGGEPLRRYADFVRKGDSPPYLALRYGGRVVGPPAFGTVTREAVPQQIVARLLDRRDPRGRR